jgi:hypothetical protein
MSLKNQLKHLLSELRIDLFMPLEVFEDQVHFSSRYINSFQEYQADWEIVVSEAKKFSNMVIDTDDNAEMIDMTYTEKVKQMSFTFNAKVFTRLFDFTFGRNNFDDNMDLFEVDDEDDDYMSD